MLVIHLEPLIAIQMLNVTWFYCMWFILTRYPTKSLWETFL